MYEANSSAEEVVNITPQKSQVVDEKPKKKFKWKKFFGYFFLGILVLGIGYLGYRFYEFKPYRVIVSNVTSRSATISWVTDSAEPGMVVYKEGNTILPIWISKYGMGNGYDDRDYSNAELEAASKTQENIAESGDISAEDIETEIIVTELGTYWSHHVSIRNLNPETEYEFMVGDGLVFEKAKTVDTEDSMVSTLKEIDEIETPIPAYGIVRYYDGLNSIVPADTIVYCVLEEEFTTVNSLTISSTVTETGGWYLDLSNAYTEDGTRFLSVISENEAVNIVLNLTIENEWFGRWSKEIKYGNTSPANEIVLYDINDENFTNSDKDLIYEGLSFVEDQESLSLVNKIYASECGEQCKTNGKVDWTCVSKCIQKSNSGGTTQLTVSQAAEAARWTAKAVSEIGKELTDNTKLSAEKKLEYQQEAEYLDERATVIQNAIDVAKASNDETVILEKSANVLYDTNLGQDMADRDDGDIYGECYANVCYPEVYGEDLTCANMDYTQCVCHCSNETDFISHGQTCSCTEDEGTINKDPDVIGDVEEIGEPYSATKGKDQGICWNNKLKTTNTDKSCYSYTNQCWYSEGYVTNDGLLCYNREGQDNEMYGDWIQEGTEDQWEEYYNREVAEGDCKYNSVTGLFEWSDGSGSTTREDCEVLNVTEVNEAEITDFESCASGTSFDTLEIKDDYMICTIGEDSYRKPFDGTVNSYEECKAAKDGNVNYTMFFVLCTKDDTGQSFVGNYENYHYDIDSFKECVSKGGYLSADVDDNGKVYYQRCELRTGQDNEFYFNWGFSFADVARNIGIVDNSNNTNEQELSIDAYNAMHNAIYNMYTLDSYVMEVMGNDGSYIIDIPSGFMFWDTYVFMNGSFYEEKDGVLTLTDEEKDLNAGPGKDCSNFDSGGTISLKESGSLRKKQVVFSEDPFTSYECKDEVWTKKEEGLAIGVVDVFVYPGEDCLPGQYCTCIYGDKDKDEKKSESFTAGTGKKCTNEGVKKAGLINNFSSNIYADNSNGYLIDTKYGIVEQLGLGSFIFIVDGNTYFVDIKSNTKSEDIYLDINGNEELDSEDINVAENFEQIIVDPIRQEFRYSLKEGFNFISFPFVFFNNIKMASDLLTYLNYIYDDAFYSISKYDSGKWTMVGSNGGTYDQNDFQLIPGQGYVLKAKTDIYITLYGNEIIYESDTDSAPIGLSEGWNLVGLYGTSVKSYTAESILADITNYEAIDFTAVNVSRWVESRALYEALQRDEDSTVYGLDFPIELKKSYFIKVTNGSGNWEPGVE